MAYLPKNNYNLGETYGPGHTLLLLASVVPPSLWGSRCCPSR